MIGLHEEIINNSFFIFTILFNAYLGAIQIQIIITFLEVIGKLVTVCTSKNYYL